MKLRRRHWIVFGACVASFLWLAISHDNSFITVLPWLISCYVLAGLFVFNLWFVLFKRGERLFRLKLALIAVVIFVGGIEVAVPLHWYVQEQWFLRTDIKRYEAMVVDVKAHPTELTTNWTALRFLKYPYPVYGCSNLDGSLTIRFTERNNYSRGSYLYYSGREIIADQTSTNFHQIKGAYYRHLTNNWYE